MTISTVVSELQSIRTYPFQVTSTQAPKLIGLKLELHSREKPPTGLCYDLEECSKVLFLGFSVGCLLPCVVPLSVAPTIHLASPTLFTIYLIGWLLPNHRCLTAMGCSRATACLSIGAAIGVSSTARGS